MSIEDLARAEMERREKRNLRDRLAREYLRSHPEMKADPEGELVTAVPEGTSEAAIRSIARHYAKQKQVREVIRSIS